MPVAAQRYGVDGRCGALPLGVAVDPRSCGDARWPEVVKNLSIDTGDRPILTLLVTVCHHRQ
jgi:hypothetical protein